MEPARRIVVDTNVFVAAGFNPGSEAARLLDAVAQGRLVLVWNQATRRETEAIVRKIPPLPWERFAPLFAAEAEHEGPVAPADEDFAAVADPDDRKFAALAAAAGATLVTNDSHLLAHRETLGVRIRTPSEFMRCCDAARDGT
jgi:uncharacterized protein